MSGQPQEEQKKCVYHPGRPAAATCPYCGKPFCESDLVITASGAKVCRGCATTLEMAPKPGPSGLAIASLVLSVSAFACGITAVPGFVIGLVELHNINRGRSPREGRGLALAGTIIGGILTGLWVLFLLLVIVVAIIGSLSGTGVNHSALLFYI